MTGDDTFVGNTKKALIDAAPRPVSEFGASEIPPKVEPQLVYSLRETYEGRVEKLDTVYRRVAGASGRPPRPKDKRGGPIDDYDNQIPEYIFSSLMVALPQPQDSRRDLGIMFQPPVSVEPESHIVQTNAGLEGRIPPTDFVAAVPDERPFEPEVEGSLVNCRTWDRELYSNLPLNPLSIRLLNIFPGSPDDDIFARMDVHPLNEVAMQYEALSYVWGNPEPAKKIFVNKVEVSVNPNLCNALLALRQPDSIRCVWIDAICINQENTQEKNNQVQNLMGQIYAKTTRLLIWLGEADETSTLAISTVERACREIEAQGGVLTFHKTDLSLVMMKDTNGKIDLAPWIAIRELLMRPWFTRAWVRTIPDCADELHANYPRTGCSGALPA